MQNYKLTIEYDGTDFSGWQIQTPSQRTVQGEIQAALYKIFKQKITPLGSGRTDSGVHALGQVANFKINTSLKVKIIQKALNAHLPKDIAILKVQKVDEAFHAQYSAKSKTYRYTIFNGPIRPALYRNHCFHYPFKLNVALMKKEAKALVGRHDFKSFQASDTSRKEKTTVRTVKGISIKKSKNFITINIEADGFLYKMVRNIVGTLLKLGSGQAEEGSLKKILAQKNRTAAFETAPAQGLTLVKVIY
ncbi:MAG TPA: tRNA pseudouridine(38-40) synthase TruA [Candidatus Omnitrophota bacterium]|nr:tRNA pseudouridine(38-40) synthase TruA [Candidatus Omnitrophota bacterium]